MKSNVLSVFVSVITFMVLVSSCKKDDTGGGNGTHKIQFKGRGSAGVVIQAVVYTVGTNPTSVTGISGATWSSPEITSSAKDLTVVINALGANASSTLTTEIYIDGVLKKSGTSVGTALSSLVNYSF